MFTVREDPCLVGLICAEKTTSYVSFCEWAENMKVCFRRIIVNRSKSFNNGETPKALYFQSIVNLVKY